jgi:hypothetical protein
VIGTICGGSDGTSGITANPAVGRAFDRWARRARLHLRGNRRADRLRVPSWRPGATPELGEAIVERPQGRGLLHRHGLRQLRARQCRGRPDDPGRKVDGRLFQVRRGSPIVGIVKPGDQPPQGGLYLLDVVPDGEPRFGFPNISDNAEIVELIACGAHLTCSPPGAARWSARPSRR